MFFIGAAVVFICVFGGFVVMGGHIEVLLEGAPKEMVIIGGAAVGAYLISNSKTVISGTGQAMKDLIKGPPFNKQDYLELLSLLYLIFKLAKSKGMLMLESHVENPEESSLFKQFPKFLENHHAVTFLCDYLRIMTMGTENAHQMEDVMNEELETHHHERSQMAGAFMSMGDGLPALGIVAAVLGVIKTMGAIDQPPPVLGRLIGGALVGTFLGVLLAYGFVGPIGNALTNIYACEAKYYQCIKAGLVAFMNGYPPAVALEFARKTILSDVRPSFYDVEKTVSELPTQG
ncbi:MAG: flagellar motor stator protein MotA [Janthinobacterium lividum]